ncbi:hypothetical protein [Desulfovibrio piger]|uniref:hypothetical protein n=1 Tax=Desulfovibrio piger TaxID=901 RepID=UPI003F0DF614
MTMERGFGVHALEVWQKNSHVKRQGKMPVKGAGKMTRTRYQFMLMSWKYPSSAA